MGSPNVIFNNFCAEKQCDEYIEWDFEVEYSQHYRCISCKAVGQSYDIDKISFSCPYLDEIVEHKRMVHVRNKAERKDLHQKLMWCKLKPFVKATMI